MEQVKFAEIIATIAHNRQLDKGGKPYIGHPQAVASMVTTEDEKTVAWLHDVVEDTPVTLDILLLMGFSAEVVDAVDAVTRRPGEDRQDYLDRVKANKIATQVKLADLKHNSDLSRIANRPLTQKDYDRSARYMREAEFLRS